MVQARLFAHGFLYDGAMDRTVTGHDTLHGILFQLADAVLCQPQ